MYHHVTGYNRARRSRSTHMTQCTYLSMHMHMHTYITYYLRTIHMFISTYICMYGLDEDVVTVPTVRISIYMSHGSHKHHKKSITSTVVWFQLPLRLFAAFKVRGQALDRLWYVHRSWSRRESRTKAMQFQEFAPRRRGRPVGVACRNGIYPSPERRTRIADPSSRNAMISFPVNTHRT